MADLDARWEKLMAIAERLANQTPPTINVNVYSDAPKKKRPRPDSLDEVADSTEGATVGSRQPYPYTS